MLSQEYYDDDDDDIHYYKRKIKILEREKFQLEQAVVDIGEILQKAKKDNELNLSSCAILDILHYIKRFVEEFENERTINPQIKNESAMDDFLTDENQSDETEDELKTVQQPSDKPVSLVKDETTRGINQAEDNVHVGTVSGGNDSEENNDNQMEMDDIQTLRKSLTKCKAHLGQTKAEKTTVKPTGDDTDFPSNSDCVDKENEHADKLMEPEDKISDSPESQTENDICDPKKKFMDNEGWIHCNCGYRTQHHSNFSRHKRKRHKSDKMEHILCDICGQCFTSTWGLTQHYDRKHKTIYEKLCSECGQVFASEWLLKGHCNTKHKQKL